MARVVHIGLWKVKEDADPSTMATVDNMIRAFKDTIPGVLEAHGGPLVYFDLPPDLVQRFGISPDVRVLARGYNHMLYAVFADEAARRAYDTAKPHLDLSPLMIPQIDGGMDGVLTVDTVLPE
jgi:hypothetical protein